MKYLIWKTVVFVTGAVGLKYKIQLPKPLECSNGF